ncbi:hypothetical protein L208DRAFT_1279939 [Tricholoma matsutake]|nr:hypothetical protein L208DRAFT_1279939 [Tricholoma matsutake 945]
MDFPLPLVVVSKFTDSKDYFTANPVTIDDIDKICSLPSLPPSDVHGSAQSRKLAETKPKKAEPDQAVTAGSELGKL